MSGIYNTGMSGLDSIATTTTNFTNNMLLNSSIIFVVALIIIVYILFNPLSPSDSSSYSNESSDSLGSIISILITFIIAILVFTILIKLLFGVDIIKYIFNVDLYQMIHDLIYGPPLPPIELPKFEVPDLRPKEQVFNIPENTYVYEDAKALCKAYGSRLATYKEVEDSYNHGGEWCNHGWSDGQMILFPTQQKTYDVLQKIKGHENDCGRPGVNGGYIANPDLKFGVNCYGKKPRMTEEEEDLMATQPMYPKTKADIEFEEKVQYWKDQISSVLVSPFNHKLWSRY
jgi:hypothetical protein